MSIPVSLRVLQPKPALRAVSSGVHVRPRPEVPIDLSELSRVLKRSVMFLNCCRTEFGEEDVTKMLTADVLTALPQMLETLQEFAFEMNAALEGNPIPDLNYQLDQGSD